MPPAAATWELYGETFHQYIGQSYSEMERGERALEHSMEKGRIEDRGTGSSRARITKQLFKVFVHACACVRSVIALPLTLLQESVPPKFSSAPCVHPGNVPFFLFG